MSEQAPAAPSADRPAVSVRPPADPPAPPAPLLTVIGEALVDLVPLAAARTFEARPGGSPFNVALGLARLGLPTALMARLADNAFGRILRRHAEAEGIDLSASPAAVEPTTLAVVSIDAQARASYDFYEQGTADWQWTAQEAARVPAGTAVLHLGSLASWTPPGDRHLHDAALRMRRRGGVLVSYDPNVRPGLMGDPARARAAVEPMAAAAHLVKASREDVEWLYPGGMEEAAERWLTLGALLVVVTDGPDGAHAFRPALPPLTRPGRDTEVADTVGAGDAFTAGLLGGLVRRGLHTPAALRGAASARLAAALDDAVLVSSLTCERVGADPPALAAGRSPMADTPLTAADLCFRDAAGGPSPDRRDRDRDRPPPAAAPSGATRP
jgi:fructokinase